MITYYSDIEQRSPEWFEHKLGRLGASMLKNIVDTKKKMQLKTPGVVLGMVSRVIAELETGFSCDSDYTSESMEWGIDNEEYVKDEIKTSECFEVGGVTNTAFKYFWLSPDMLEPTKGYEIKCPDSKTFAKIVIENTIHKDHIVQVLAYMAVIPELESVDYVVYDPRFKGKKIHIITAKREDYTEQIENIAISLIRFDKLVELNRKLFN